MATFATVDDVLLYTAVEVDESDIVRAEMDVVMMCGMTIVDFDEDYYHDRDLECLKLATCFQAVWLKENGPGQYSNHDVSNYSQDGESSSLNPSGLVLAPRARMWINNLTWMRSRKARMPGTGRDSNKVDMDSVRGGGIWYPLGFDEGVQYVR